MKPRNHSSRGFAIPAALALLALVLSSCATDSYEKGQGTYSLMQTEMGELAVDDEKQIVAFTTDDGDTYALTAPASAQWIQTADTTYRAIIYYNKVEENRAEVLGVSSVATLKPVEHWRYEQQPQDPVGFESGWIAKSRKYINLGLLFKSGYVDDAIGHHVISLAQDTVMVNANQTRTAYYRLLHDQNDTPEDFASRHYVSILLPQQLPDTVQLSIATYNGEIQRSFVMR